MWIGSVSIGNEAELGRGRDYCRKLRLTLFFFFCVFIDAIARKRHRATTLTNSTLDFACSLVFPDCEMIRILKSLIVTPSSLPNNISKFDTLSSHLPPRLPDRVRFASPLSLWPAREYAEWTDVSSSIPSPNRMFAVIRATLCPRPCELHQSSILSFPETPHLWSNSSIRLGGEICS